MRSGSAPKQQQQQQEARLARPLATPNIDQHRAFLLRAVLGARPDSRLFRAMFMYLPLRDSPNENPHVELALQPGELLLVHGPMDEDRFYWGETLDGRAGLVPSNFVQRVSDQEMAELTNVDPTTAAAAVANGGGGNSDGQQQQATNRRQPPQPHHQLQHTQQLHLHCPTVASTSSAAAFAPSSVLSIIAGHQQFYGISNNSSSSESRPGSPSFALAVPPHLVQIDHDFTADNTSSSADVAKQQMGTTPMTGMVGGHQQQQQHLPDSICPYPPVDVSKVTVQEIRPSMDQPRVACPRELQVERRLSRSLLISWLPPEGGTSISITTTTTSLHQRQQTISQYQVCVNGQIRAVVPGTFKCRALLEDLELNKFVNVSVRAVTADGIASPDAGCTLAVGTEAPVAPQHLRVNNATPMSAQFNWYPSNSEAEHVVLLNAIKVGVCPPTVFQVQLNGLCPSTIYRLSVRTKHPRAVLEKRPVERCVDFKTLPKIGVPDPPADVQAEQGPQPGTLLLSWRPTSGQPRPPSRAAVHSYLVYADGRCIAQVPGSTADHVLLRLADFAEDPPMFITVRTRTKEGTMSADSNVVRVPRGAAFGTEATATTMMMMGSGNGGNAIAAADLIKPEMMMEQQQRRQQQQQLAAMGSSGKSNSVLFSSSLPASNLLGQLVLSPLLPPAQPPIVSQQQNSNNITNLTTLLATTTTSSHRQQQPVFAYSQQQQYHSQPHLLMPLTTTTTAINSSSTTTSMPTGSSSQPIKAVPLQNGGGAMMPSYGCCWEVLSSNQPVVDSSAAVRPAAARHPMVGWPSSVQQQQQQQYFTFHPQALHKEYPRMDERPDVLAMEQNYLLRHQQRQRIRSATPERRSLHQQQQLPSSARQPHITAASRATILPGAKQQQPTAAAAGLPPHQLARLRHEWNGGTRSEPDLRPSRVPGVEKSRWFVAILDHQPPGLNASNELPFRRHQLVKVFGDVDGNGYFWAEVRGRFGLVPAGKLVEIAKDDLFLASKQRRPTIGTTTTGMEMLAGEAGGGERGGGEGGRAMAAGWQQHQQQTNAATTSLRRMRWGSIKSRSYEHTTGTRQQQHQQRQQHRASFLATEVGNGGGAGLLSDDYRSEIGNWPPLLASGNSWTAGGGGEGGVGGGMLAMMPDGQMLMMEQQRRMSAAAMETDGTGKNGENAGGGGGSGTTGRRQQQIGKRQQPTIMGEEIGERAGRGGGGRGEGRTGYRLPTVNGARTTATTMVGGGTAAALVGWREQQQGWEEENGGEEEEGQEEYNSGNSELMMIGGGGGEYAGEEEEENGGGIQQQQMMMMAAAQAPTLRGPQTLLMEAKYDYDSRQLSPNVDAEQVELSFRQGDLITVYGPMDEDGFYLGELNGVRGLVPSNFLQPAVSSHQQPSEQQVVTTSLQSSATMAQLPTATTTTNSLSRPKGVAFSANIAMEANNTAKTTSVGWQQQNLTGGGKAAAGKRAVTATGSGAIPTGGGPRLGGGTSTGASGMTSKAFKVAGIAQAMGGSKSLTKKSSDMQRGIQQQQAANRKSSQGVKGGGVGGGGSGTGTTTTKQKKG